MSAAEDGVAVEIGRISLKNGHVRTSLGLP